MLGVALALCGCGTARDADEDPDISQTEATGDEDGDGGDTTGAGSEEGTTAAVDESTAGVDETTDDDDTADADTTASTTTGTSDEGTTAAGPPDLLFLSIEPLDSLVELDLDETGNVDFTVTAHYDDGTEEIVTDDVEAWEVSNGAVGSMTTPTLDIPGYASSFFESTLVTASIGDDAANAQVTVAAYAQTGPDADFFFVLPYLDPDGSQTKPLDFSTDVKNLDVFFNVDTTASMSGPINNLQASIAGTIIPAIAAEVADAQFGAGAFEDFPIDPFGEAVCDYFGPSDPDQPFELLQEVTDDSSAVQTAVNGLSLPGGDPIGCGADGPESNIEALYQIATGAGITGPGLTSVAPNTNGVGGVAFRDGTLPVIVSVTDAVSHENDGVCISSSYPANAGVAAVAHDRAELFTALDAICARVVPVAVDNFSGACGPLADGTEFATESGAVIPPEAWDELPGGRPPGCAADTCCTGLLGAGVAANSDGLCPLVYRVDLAGNGLDDTIVDGVGMLARYARFDVTTAAEGQAQDVDGVATPMGTTTADFFVAITPSDHGPVPVQGVPDPTLTATTFEGVVPDTDVTFSIEAHNDFVPQGSTPRLFVATIRVVADGCSDLDEREVFILVPPQQLPRPG